MGMFNTPVDGMVTAIAESDSFQAWVGAADADAARDYIFKYATPFSDLPALATKWATVSSGPDWNLDRVANAGGIGSFEVTTGTLFTLQWLAGTYSDANLATFLTDLDAIVQDLIDNSGSNAAPRIISRLEQVIDPRAQADYGEIPTYRLPIGGAVGYIAIFAEATVLG